MSLKIGRNNPCPCGSGKKYKKCCLDKDHQSEAGTPSKRVFTDLIAGDYLKSQKITKVRRAEKIDLTDGKCCGCNHVVIGDYIYYSPYWISTVDFFLFYLLVPFKEILNKSLPIDHQINELFLKAHDYMMKQRPNNYQCIPNGPMKSIVHMSYDLFSVMKYAKCEDLIKRLSIPDQFQGARHELFTIASCIRSGYGINYDNEKDGSTRHFECSIIELSTNQQIDIEAKSRRRPGVLGQSGNQMKPEEVSLRIGRLLNDAIDKQRGNPYFVFIDVNYPPDAKLPLWESLRKVLINAIKLPTGGKAPNLLVLTNHPYHYGDDDKTYPRESVIAIQGHLLEKPTWDIIDKRVYKSFEKTLLTWDVPQFFEELH